MKAFPLGYASGGRCQWPGQRLWHLLRGMRVHALGLDKLVAGVVVATLLALTACRGNTASASNPTAIATFAPSSAGELVLLIDQRLVVVSAQGQQRDLVHTQGASTYPGSPRWSPDGSRVAYVQRQFFNGVAGADWGDDIYVVPEGGGASELLHRHAETGQQVAGLAWSPDGSRLVFGLFEPILANGQIQNYATHIVELDLTTKIEHNILDQAFDPSFSSDGTRMAYTADGSGLAVADSDGQHSTLLVPSSAFPTTAYPRISPNGETVVFSASNPVAAIPSRRAPTELAKLFDSLGPARAEAHGLPMDLWRVEVGTGKLTRLTNLGADDPSSAWSADGGTLVMFATGGLYELAADGSHLQHIGPGAFLGQVDVH